MTSTDAHPLLPRNYTDRIEICGGIASGKTTLAKLLGNNVALPVLENFQSNPFWKSFYADPIGNAFETEISFLLQHYHEIKVAAGNGERFSCDFAMILDLAYAQVTLSGTRLDIFQAVFQEVIQEIGPPRLLINLECDARIEGDRVRARGRDVEKAITVSYLDSVNRALDRVIEAKARGWQVLSIDSSTINFYDDAFGRQSTLNLVTSRLSQ